MATALVVLVSLLVGAATYVATVRGGRRTPAAVGFDAPAAAIAVEPEPAAVPRTGDDEDDDLEAEVDDEAGTDAEVVELDAMREGGGPSPAAPDDADGGVADRGAVDEETGPEEATSDADPIAADGATTPIAPLAPVIVNAPPAPAPEPGYSYLRVATEGPSWRDRIAGVLGLTILLVVGAGAVAFGIYQLGTAINAVLQRFLEG